MGKTRKYNALFIFVFALSQFSGPDYLEARKRLVAPKMCLQVAYLKEINGLVACVAALLDTIHTKQYPDTDN